MFIKNEKDKTIDIIRVLLGVVTGFIFCKYTKIFFNFLTPMITFSTLFYMNKFSIKLFIKKNWWIFGFSCIGLILSEILVGKPLIFAIITFGIFFSCFFFIHKNITGVNSGVLGYTFTTIYFTYASTPIESMVKDMAISIFISGCIAWILFFIFPTGKANLDITKQEREDVHRDVFNTIKITTIIFIVWLFYMFYDIKDTFFAYATLCGLYGNLSFNKIYVLTLPNILINISGCILAIILSFFINGISTNPIIFSLSLMIIFFPMLYFGYYEKTPKIKILSLSLIRATIFPIGLYLTPYGDIVSKAFARALQITTMLIISMILIKLLMIIKGEENE